MVAFEASVIAIGLVGGIANLLMLLTLAHSKARKYEMAIVFNQMTLDFLCCLQLVITYSVKVLDFDYNDNYSASLLCKAFGGEMMLWYILGSSTDNLVVLTLERYVKIVHAVFHKRYFRRWMYFVAIALTWVNFTVICSAVISSLGTVVIDGKCMSYAKVPAAINAKAFGVYKFFDDFFLPLVVFMFCYTRILKVTNKRIVPVNFNNMMRSAAQQMAMKTQMNVIKTFLFISVCFILCWFPNRLYFFLYNLRIVTSHTSDARYITVFLAFLNVCLNPFIYAAKLDPVKKYLRQKLCNRRRKKSDETVVSVINNSPDVQMSGNFQEVSNLSANA